MTAKCDSQSPGPRERGPRRGARGKLPDYYLVPGRNLDEDGVATVQKLAELRPLGRRWYGLHRVGSDLVE